YETGNNIIAKIITVVAWVVFIGGFVLGIIVGSNTGNPLAAYAKYEPEFNFLSAIFCWAGAFISGCLYGFVTFMLAVISVSFLPQSFSNIMGVLFIPVFSILIKAFLRGAGFLFLAELLKVLEGIKNK
ncbi:MAG: hypothetical protein J6036_01875, partial [Clostridia bacterium]|nr:hypothetical protein [Clostridia bacterium]